MHRMDETLDALCEVFDRELERQRRIRDLAAGQHEAILAREAQRLESQTAELRTVIEETLDAEKERIALLKTLVGHMGLPEENQTLTGLIAAAPEPWKGRMARFQREIRSVMEESRALVRDNNRLLRFSLKWTNTCLSVLDQWFGAGPADYDARGEPPSRTQQRPTVIDQRG